MVWDSAHDAYGVPLCHLGVGCKGCRGACPYALRVSEHFSGLLKVRGSGANELMRILRTEQ
jgi:hypothetical protein